MQESSSLSFRAPDTTCNARLARSSGYCEAVAGADGEFILDSIPTEAKQVVAAEPTFPPPP